MKVILLKSVVNLGRVGKVVDVADGYAVNFLLPRRLVMRASKENLEKFSLIKKDLELKCLKMKRDAEREALSLAKKDIVIIAQSSVGGKLFGSVSARMLSIKLSKLLQREVNYKDVVLPEPIRFNGIYYVDFALHPDVKIKVRVIIARDDLEVKELLKS